MDGGRGGGRSGFQDTQGEKPARHGIRTDTPPHSRTASNPLGDDGLLGGAGAGGGANATKPGLPSWVRGRRTSRNNHAIGSQDTVQWSPSPRWAELHGHRLKVWMAPPTRQGWERCGEGGGGKQSCIFSIFIVYIWMLLLKGYRNTL